jgi:O-antigen/teichoic acid export membrane protein
LAAEACHQPLVTVTRNIVANFLGQGWRALIAFAFVPLYIQYLGIESYALIGIFTLMLAWLSVIDTGLRATLGREMARFSGGALDATAIRDVLRTVELIVLAFGLLSALAIGGASGYLAKWVHSEHLPLQTVAVAFAAMGLVVMLSFSEGMYLGCLSGLQQQVTENAIMIVSGTVRSLGAVLIIIFVSRTIEAFFVWQALVSLMNIAAARMIVYRVLPPGERAAHPSWKVIRTFWRFAVGISSMSFVWFLSAQIDKLILSRALTLADFGYYTMAASAAGFIGMLSRPAIAAFYPRLVELVAQGDEAGALDTYHTAAQTVTVFSAAAAVSLAAFSHDLLLLWTRDSALSTDVAPLLSILACGALIQTMAIVPNGMQTAHGWTSLGVFAGTASMCLITPVMLWAIPRYGTIGAAFSSAALMSAYTILTVVPMHRRILREEMMRWCGADVLAPTVAAAAAASACAFVVPRGLGFFASLAAMTASTIIVFTAALMGAGQLRGLALQRLIFALRQLRAKAPAGAHERR